MKDEEKTFISHLQLKYIRAFEMLAAKYKKEVNIPMSSELIKRITTNLTSGGQK